MQRGVGEVDFGPPTYDFRENYAKTLKEQRSSMGGKLLQGKLLHIYWLP